MEESKKYFEANQQMWDDKTPIHAQSAFYDVATFRQTHNSLNRIEQEDIGDVQGKSLLHLQCHFGMDTLSWAKKGAHVVGVDFSQEATDLATSLSNELGIPAQFICSNVLELKDKIDQQFDIVFTSYGVICWLPDLNLWAQTIRQHLKPGGFFYIAETHPLIMSYDLDNYQLKYSYFYQSTPDEETIEGTYADLDAPLKHTEYTWGHSLSEVINALINQGLQIDFLNEFPYYPYNCFPNMAETSTGSGLWQVKAWGNKIPHLFTLKATCPQ